MASETGVTSPGPPVTVREIRTRSGFEALRAEWDRLGEMGGASSPFLSHDWFRCCLDRQENPELLILALVREGEIQGIAPLWSQPERMRGGLKLRCLGFISSPDTPETDLLVREEERLETIRALLRHIYGLAREGYDFASLGQWPSESPNCIAVRGLLAEERRPSFVGVTSIAPHVPISGDWEAFWRSLSPMFRKSRRGILNRMARAGAVEVECIREDPEGARLADLLSVAERGWKQSEGVSMAARAETRRFFESLTQAASRNGWLFAWLLRLNGTPIAMEYDLAYRGRVYALRADYDESHRQLSPGAYLEYQIVRRLFEEGYQEYNSGPGLDSYKLRWTDRSRENISVNLCLPTWKGTAAWLLEGRLLPLLRRIRAAGKPGTDAARARAEVGPAPTGPA